jgi:hypothetical protein
LIVCERCDAFGEELLTAERAEKAAEDVTKKLRFSNRPE